MNERTISLESKHDKLINNCNNTPVSIHDTVDHQTTHKDKETLFINSTEHTFITTSALTNAYNAAVGGAGRLVHKKAEHDRKPVMRGLS